jgi:tetratricopeptide (TPR) repeat protein
MLFKAVEAAPANYRVRIALASFYASPSQSNLERAEQHARQAAQIDPGRADAYAILARTYVARGRWSDLDSVLATAEREVPDDFVPAYRAGETLLASGSEIDRAVRCFRKYLSGEPEGNAPTLADAQRKLGLAQEKLTHHE